LGDSTDPRIAYRFQPRRFDFHLTPLASSSALRQRRLLSTWERNSAVVVASTPPRSSGHLRLLPREREVPLQIVVDP